MRVAAAVAPLRVRSPRVPRAGLAEPTEPGAGLVGEGAALPLLAAARARAPLRLALARLAARLVATHAWERLGFARLADYARERTGLSARQLQDLAHTSRCLEGLPRVRAELAAGRLGWSQARLIARVATPEDEARWIGFAHRVRVRELEHAVRRADTGSIEAGTLETDEDGCDASLRIGVVVRCAPWVQSKFHQARVLARRAAGEALPNWACMEAVAAEALSALPAGGSVDEPEAADVCAQVACAEAGPAGTSWAEAASVCAIQGLEGEVPSPGMAGVCTRPGTEQAAAPWPGLADVCAEEDAHEASWLRPANVCADHGPEVDDRVAALLEGLEHADAFELDARLRRAVRLEQRLDAELAPLLARLALPNLSLETFARERLGMSPRNARALRRIEREAARCPALREAFRSGRLSWVQVQAILPVLPLCPSPHQRTRWIEHAEQVSVRRLEDDVDRALHTGLPEPQRQTCAQPRDPQTDPHTTPAEPDPETARFFFSAPADVARLFRAVVCSVRRRIERTTGRLPTEGAAVEWMFDHAFEAWGANQSRVRREHRVFERDGWRCTVPGCSSYRNLHDHHIVFRAAGGADDLGNRTTLCAFHHLRGVHAARVRCAGTAPDGLVFELGLRPGRAPLLRFAPGERVVASSA